MLRREDSVTGDEVRLLLSGKRFWLSGNKRTMTERE